MIVLVHSRKSLDSYVLWDTIKNSFENVNLETLTKRLKREKQTILGVVLENDCAKVSPNVKKNYLSYLDRSDLGNNKTLITKFNAAHEYAKAMVEQG